jgi:hypothetical protein
MKARFVTFLGEVGTVETVGGYAIPSNARVASLIERVVVPGGVLTPADGDLLVRALPVVYAGSRLRVELDGAGVGRSVVSSEKSAFFAWVETDEDAKAWRGREDEAWAAYKEWRESEHPRDRRGRFAEKPGGGVLAAAERLADALRGSPQAGGGDTPQQRAILRQNATARKVRAKFPPGTRVASIGGTPPRRIQEGTVVRHVPGSNAQGGTLVVEWDNGRTSRLSPISVEKIDDTLSSPGERGDSSESPGGGEERGETASEYLARVEREKRERARREERYEEIYREIYRRLKEDGDPATPNTRSIARGIAINVQAYEEGRPNAEILVGPRFRDIARREGDETLGSPGREPKKRLTKKERERRRTLAEQVAFERADFEMSLGEGQTPIPFDRNEVFTSLRQILQARRPLSEDRATSREEAVREANEIIDDEFVERAQQMVPRMRRDLEDFGGEDEDVLSGPADEPLSAIDHEAVRILDESDGGLRTLGLKLKMEAAGVDVEGLSVTDVLADLERRGLVERSGAGEWKATDEGRRALGRGGEPDPEPEPDEPGAADRSILEILRDSREKGVGYAAVKNGLGRRGDPEGLLNKRGGFTGRLAELVDRGLAERHDDEESIYPRWTLTDAGRRFLEGKPEPEPEDEGLALIEITALESISDVVGDGELGTRSVAINLAGRGIPTTTIDAAGGAMGVLVDLRRRGLVEGREELDAFGNLKEVHWKLTDAGWAAIGREKGDQPESPVRKVERLAVEAIAAEFDERGSVEVGLEAIRRRLLDGPTTRDEIRDTHGDSRNVLAALRARGLVEGRGEAGISLWSLTDAGWESIGRQRLTNAAIENAKLRREWDSLGGPKSMNRRVHAALYQLGKDNQDGWVATYEVAAAIGESPADTREMLRISGWIEPREGDDENDPLVRSLRRTDQDRWRLTDVGYVRAQAAGAENDLLLVATGLEADDTDLGAFVRRMDEGRWHPIHDKRIVGITGDPENVLEQVEVARFGDEIKLMLTFRPHDPAKRSQRDRGGTTSVITGRDWKVDDFSGDEVEAFVQAELREAVEREREFSALKLTKENDPDQVPRDLPFEERARKLAEISRELNAALSPKPGEPQSFRGEPDPEHVRRADRAIELLGEEIDAEARRNAPEVRQLTEDERFALQVEAANLVKQSDERVQAMNDVTFAEFQKARAKLGDDVRRMGDEAYYVRRSLVVHEYGKDPVEKNPRSYADLHWATTQFFHRKAKRTKEWKALAAAQERNLARRREIQAALEDPAKAVASGRRDAYLAALGRVRPLGGNLDAGVKKGAAFEDMKEVSRYFPTEWIEASNASDRQLVAARSKSRGHYSHTKLSRGKGVVSEIKISAGGSGIPGEDTYRSTATHELMHRMEYVYGGIVRAEARFYAKRTAGEVAQRLQKLQKGYGYRADEIAREDKFSEPYMGKDYGGRAWELMTMGMEGLMHGKYRMEEDDEYRRWVLGVLAGL